MTGLSYIYLNQDTTNIFIKLNMEWHTTRDKPTKKPGANQAFGPDPRYEGGGGVLDYIAPSRSMLANCLRKKSQIKYREI